MNLEILHKKLMIFIVLMRQQSWETAVLMATSGLHPLPPVRPPDESYQV